MSWMSPENITPRETDPKDELGKFRIEYGSDATTILGIMGDLDPLRIYGKDDEYDDKRSRHYIKYATRFMDQLGERTLRDLSGDELLDILKKSFEDCSDKTFDLEYLHSYLSQTIETLRSQKKE